MSKQNGEASQTRNIIIVSTAINQPQDELLTEDLLASQVILALRTGNVGTFKPRAFFMLTSYWFVSSPEPVSRIKMQIYVDQWMLPA